MRLVLSKPVVLYVATAVVVLVVANSVKAGRPPLTRTFDLIPLT